MSYRFSSRVRPCPASDFGANYGTSVALLFNRLNVIHVVAR
jgi:hypothetical protein